MSSSIIINFDLVEKVSINTKSNTAQIDLCSGKKLMLSHQELKDFLNMLSAYQELIKQQLLSYTEKEDHL
ncbi:hypothetical protein [Xenococcus sp. PCC 7305]|uniref:hypothetical protein n=1 Tax=Xenococcus sp. PCC 7305 TaxID=102125 RepID=UPI0003122412|nr:hypothetical protein [Xenococcus sp. PCC 7305]